MRLQRHVVVLDAADIEAVSTFWARMLGGRVYADETFHCVLDSDGRWLLGVQLAADHEAPGWPDGNAQQIHLDLHVEDPNEAHREAMNCGARLLQEADDLDANLSCSMTRRARARSRSMVGISESSHGAFSGSTLSDPEAAPRSASQRRASPATPLPRRTRRESDVGYTASEARRHSCVDGLGAGRSVPG
jgi:hypothetical protein